MKKIILRTITAALSFALLSGCGRSETSSTADKSTSSSSVLSNDEISSLIAGLSPDEEIILDEINVTEETQKEVKTKAETAEELVASVLKAFCEKDAETFDTLVASCTGINNGYTVKYYSALYNDWCKVADEAGIDWKNLTVSASDWEIYRLDYSLVDYIWIEMYYPPLSESFSLHLGIDEFDYNTETYSLKYISSNRGIKADEFQKFDEYVNTGEKTPVRGVTVAVYSVDIEKYLN